MYYLSPGLCPPGVVVDHALDAAAVADLAGLGAAVDGPQVAAGGASAPPAQPLELVLGRRGGQVHQRQQIHLLPGSLTPSTSSDTHPTTKAPPLYIFNSGNNIKYHKLGCISLPRETDNVVAPAMYEKVLLPDSGFFSIPKRGLHQSKLSHRPK